MSLVNMNYVSFVSSNTLYYDVQSFDIYSYIYILIRDEKNCNPFIKKTCKPSSIKFGTIKKSAENKKNKYGSISTARRRLF